MNLIQLIFCSFTSIIVVYGVILNLFEEKLPKVVSQCIRYGKFSIKEKNWLITEVPKAWFKHFYASAVPVFTCLLYLVTSVYVFKNPVPEWVTLLLKVLCGEERISFVPASKVYVASILMTLQVYRRFYDTHFVSVFGGNSQMNFMLYIVGLVHYPGAALAIICEAPLFSKSPSFVSVNVFDFSQWTYFEIATVALFLWAWLHQHICTKILANLRKDKKGNVVTIGHKIPQGDWFKYLSCPHQTAEILMYFSITIILWHNITWFFVFTWVLSNQIETILLSHWWYKETFSDFPKQRKALIPFVY